MVSKAGNCRCHLVTNDGACLLVLSYIIVTMFNIGGRSDTSLQRDLHQLDSLANVLLTTFLPLCGVWTSSDLGTMALQQEDGRHATICTPRCIITIMNCCYHGIRLDLYRSSCLAIS